MESEINKKLLKKVKVYCNDTANSVSIKVGILTGQDALYVSIRTDPGKPSIDIPTSKVVRIEQVDA